MSKFVDALVENFERWENDPAGMMKEIGDDAAAYGAALAEADPVEIMKSLKEQTLYDIRKHGSDVCWLSRRKAVRKMYHAAADMEAWRRFVAAGGEVPAANGMTE